MAKTPTVSAEVVLKPPPGGHEESADLVAQRLQSLGIKVVDIGPRSVSIQAGREAFERVFACKLVPHDDKSSPARSYGRIGGPALRPSSPPTVPSDLQEYIASVEVQEPPMMF